MGLKLFWDAVLKGVFPAKQLKLVLAWCEIHKEELMKNWLSAREHGKIEKIECNHSSKL